MYIEHDKGINEDYGENNDDNKRRIFSINSKL